MSQNKGPDVAGLNSNTNPNLNHNNGRPTTNPSLNPNHGFPVYTQRCSVGFSVVLPR